MTQMSAHTTLHLREDCTMFKLCEHDPYLLEEFWWTFCDKETHVF